MDRPHGNDISYYRVINPDRPVTTPLPTDIMIVCAVWGTWELPNWKYNLEQLKKYKYRGVYGAYRAYNSGKQMADAIVARAKEAKAHFIGLDFESYFGHDITAADVPRLKDWYNAVEALGWKVVVYGSQSKMYLIQQADPEFAAHMEMWVAFDLKSPDLTNYSTKYIPLIKRPFNTARFAQYDTHLNGAYYGINFVNYEATDINSGKPATTLDGDVYIHTQPIDEWLEIEEETPPDNGQETDLNGIIKYVVEVLKSLIAFLEGLLD